jgi:hypothetical protein
MISTGIFPTRLKFAEIKPLHKKGKKSNISNYRSISLLTSFSKIFEKIIFTRLTHHLSDNHILANEQFSFRHELSTDSGLFKLINDILTSLNNKLLVGGIFCDLQKAFDCVDHDLLLSKMHWYGISGKGFDLIQSYLKNRYQRVIISNKSKQYFSEWEPIKYGVPQGSILGPLFFILYINNLPKTMATSANPVLFADDTIMIITNPNLMEFTNSINVNSIKINKWFKSNSLSLNIDKTHFLQFFTKTDQTYDFQPYYDNKQITKVGTIKFLGITLDSKLSWKQHIEDLT